MGSEGCSWALQTIPLGDWHLLLSVSENLDCSREDTEQALGLSGFIYTLGICVWDNDFTGNSTDIFINVFPT